MSFTLTAVTVTREVTREVTERLAPRSENGSPVRRRVSVPPKPRCPLAVCVSDVKAWRVRSCLCAPEASAHRVGVGFAAGRLLLTF